MTGKLKSLDFIDDKLLTRYVEELLSKMELVTQQKEKSLYKNVVDPFSAIFDSMRQHISMEEWLEQEKTRQTQKSLQNLIGIFHQKIIGSVKGWENLGVGKSIDVRNRRKKIIAEVKNKYNTMNSGSSLAIYDKLQKHLDFDESYKGYVAYCVVIVPKSSKPLNTPFHPSERGVQRQTRQDIRIIDGNSFYTLATGDKGALLHLYEKLPLIIGNLLNIDSGQIMSSELFKLLFDKVYM